MNGINNISMLKCEDLNNLINFFEDIRNTEGSYILSMGNKSEQGLRLSLKYAISQINASLPIMFEEDKLDCCNKILNTIDQIFTEINTKENQEIQFKILNQLKKEVLKHVNTTDFKVKDFDFTIFRGQKEFIFFINTLREANVIDNNSKPLPKFQALSKAVFDNKNYKEHIFTYDLAMKTFVLFLNNTYGTRINTDSMSKGFSHEEFVEKYFNKNFTRN
ncbi:hypothetical protein [Tenacibaculum halocynthiae]|uniref:hypothetical protein n=1 Tax=Tenacibaculum halocynthiae TaxID=1254437 RepID=UPI0038944E85